MLLRKPLLIVLLRGEYLYSLALLVCFAVGLWLYSQPSVWTSLPLASLVSGKKVVIDAGHGGIDPGARSESGLLEKDLNLDVALRLKRYLSQVGVYCVMIRELDCDFTDGPEKLRHKKRQDLLHRARLANESNADIYLSIHANSFPERQYRGAQTFYERGSAESQRLAKAIQNQLVLKLGPNNRKIKPGDFRVLQDSHMPAVTVEVGFLSNPQEATLLSQPEYRERLAEAIYQGVVAYFAGLGQE